MTALMQKIMTSLQKHLAPMVAKMLRKSLAHQNSSGLTTPVPSPVSRQKFAEKSYRPCRDSAVIRQSLISLSQDLFELAKKRQQANGEMRIMRSGEIGRRQRYFYTQALSEDGWLFEQTSQGWTITRATLIADGAGDAGNVTFLRSRESWDQVTILQNEPESTSFRINSERFGSDHLSYFIYRELMATALGLHDTM